ncbi:MAG TPA: pitrilysin family protein [Steroidobacteraceae bacterium]|nr:pitrilysin family protein [Steroidobacteraceae bacterium]
MSLPPLLLAPWSGGAAARAAERAPQIAFESYRLKNGLQVILSEDHRLPLVAVNLWYHVGPANERPGRTGFAHLFEHMMFQGSGHVAHDAHIKLLEAAGATDLNGTTDFDRTNYFETLPAEQLPLALWLESDRMGFLLDTLDQAKLTNQKDVVRNERRQSIENRPYGLVQEELYHQLFPPGHPYHADVMGSHADIEAARLGDVREFFRTYYVPNNASLAIVGDIDPRQTKAWVEKYFGSLPPGERVPALDVRTAPITAEKHVVVHDRVELPRVYIGWLTAPIFRPGDAEADVLAEILGGGRSSRLYQHLVHDRQLAQDVRASQSSLQLASVFTIEATARPGVKPEDLEAAIDAELQELAAHGPTPEEVERASITIQARMIRGLERLGGFGGVADRLNEYNHYLGRPDYLASDLGRYQKVKPAAVQSLVAHTLTRDARVVVYGMPGEKVIEDVPRSGAEETAAGAAGSSTASSSTASSSAASGSTAGTPAPQQSDAAREAWRDQPPMPGAARPLSLPMPEHFTLPNGLTVLLVEQHRLPLVAADLLVLSGSEANPPDRPGLASLTAALLDQGTTRRSALAIANELGQIGATLATGSSSDASYIDLRTLKDHVEPAFDLLADVALHPAFAPEELERLRSRRLTELQQQHDNPTALAARAFSEALYGAQHPYGAIELGTPASLQALTREELLAFWKAGYTPANAALVVAGDLTLAETRRLAQRYFGDWRGTAHHATLPAAPGPAARHVVLIDLGRAPQTALRIGEIGVQRGSTDYVPLQVMNTVLGGIFSSRINLNLRERHGYTYGASSGFGFRRGPGPFVIGTSVRTDVTAPAVHEIFEELARIRAEPVTPAELELARNAYARSLLGDFETTAATARSIGQLFIYGLPLDDYRTLPQRIEAVSIADVQRVASTHLSPESMVIVAAGDRARIEPALAQLALGPIEVRPEP